MNSWISFLVLAAIFGGVMFLMHRQGLVVSKAISAVLFLFLPEDHADLATLNTCSGYVRHAGRFRESRVYTFVLDVQLTNGDAEVCLLDQKKQELLRLNRFHPTGRIELDQKSRYYIYWEFRSATGACALRW